MERGIGINRQYDADWYSHATLTNTIYVGFKGNKPEEAKDVMSVLSLGRNDNTKIVLSYHSSEEIIY